MNFRFVAGDLGEESTGEEGDDGACVRATRRCLRVRTFGPLVAILEDLTRSSWSSPAGNRARGSLAPYRFSRFPIFVQPISVQDKVQVQDKMSTHRAIRRLHDDYYHYLTLAVCDSCRILRALSNVSKTCPQCRSREAFRRRG